MAFDSFELFIKNLEETPGALEAYADRCGTTPGYITKHLKSARKIPRPRLLEALWQESDSRITREKVFEHFLPTPSLNIAAANDAVAGRANYG